MKIFKTALIILMLLLIVVISVVISQTSRIIKTGVTKVVPRVLGVPAKLDDVRISLLRGRISASGLVIGNPEGFKTDHLFKINRFKVDFVPRSMFSGKIIIRNITVVSPDIIYEQTLSGNNFGKVMENLKTAQAEEVREEKENAASGKKDGRKVEIAKISIRDGMINVSMPGMGAVPIPLPPVQMTDIGREGEGASVEEAVNLVFSAIFDGVTKAVLSSGDYIRGGIKDLGKGATAGAQALGSTAKDAGKEAGVAVDKGVEAVKGLLSP